jgi:hypothetical protein
MSIIITAPSLPVVKFPLGTIALTANAASRLDRFVVHEGLRRHARGDWGDICPEDACENELALKAGLRLFSAYGKGENRFWIVSEADRSATTVLLPVDY